MPSIAGGHSSARPNRRRYRERSRDVSASIRRSVPFRSQLRAPPLLARTRSYYELGSRPRSPLAPRVKGYGGRFTEPGYRPTTSATTSTTREHTLERPVLAFPPGAVNVAIALGGRPRLRRSCLGSSAPPLSRELGEGREPRQSFRNAPPGAYKRAEEPRPENHRPFVTPLAGDASTQPPLAAAAGWTTVLDCTSREASSEGPPQTRPAAAGRRG